MILNERMTLLYCFVTALADGSEGAAFLVGRSGHSGCAGRRGSAAGARRAHHARTNTDLPSGRRPCMRRTLRLGGQRFAKPATASRPSRRSLERDASTRKRSSSRKAKVRPLSCRRICPSRGRRRSRRSSVRFHGGLFESPLTDSNRRPLLTIEQRGGSGGQGWEAAGTEVSQEKGIARRRVTSRGLRCPRWCSLRIPSAMPEPDRPAEPSRASRQW